MIMDIFFEIFFGAYAGWMTSQRANSLSLSIFLGMVGSVALSFILQALGLPGVYGYNLYSFFASITGAVAGVHIGRMLLATPLPGTNPGLGTIPGMPILKPSLPHVV
jgi:uncharacterized membrane protein YeaQ/YmgE (transglycosylase-associated protein family)